MGKSIENPDVAEHIANEDSASWDARYAGDPQAPSSQVNPEFADRAAVLSPGRAVDLGCGTGRHARWLAARGWQVQACDFAGVAIEQARAVGFEGAGHIDYQVADIRDFTPDGPVDLVLMSYVQLQAGDLRALLTSASGWLRSDGRLIYTCHSREGLVHGAGGGPQDPAILPTLAELADAVGAMKVNTLQHTLQSNTIDVVLECQRWPDAPLRSDSLV